MWEAFSQILAEKGITALWNGLRNSLHCKSLLAWLLNPPYYADLIAKTLLPKVDQNAIKGTLEEHFRNIGLHFKLESLGKNYLEFKLSKFIAPIIVKWSEDSAHLMQAENEGAGVADILFEVEFTGYVVERYRGFRHRLKEMARFLVEVSSLIASKFDGEKPELIITINRTRSLSPFEGEDFAPQAPKSLKREGFAGGVMHADECSIQLIIDSVESVKNFDLSPFLAKLRPCEKTH